jgi:hypothetical protein
VSADQLCGVALPDHGIWQRHGSLSGKSPHSCGEFPYRAYVLLFKNSCSSRELCRGYADCRFLRRWDPMIGLTE